MAATDKYAFQYLMQDGSVKTPSRRDRGSDWIVETYVEEPDHAHATYIQTMVVRVRHDLEPSSLHGRFEDSELHETRKELLQNLVDSDPVERVVRKKL